jgi:hypothetical protein
VLIFALSITLAACGGDDENNGGGTNIVPGNNSTSNNSNNSTSNNTAPNNTTPNNSTSPNNVVTAPDCIALNPALEGECDVLCQSGCVVSQACTITPPVVDPEVEEVLSWTASCAPAGTGGNGDACSVNEDCQQGFGCVDSVCLQYCRTGGDEAPQCPPSLICVPFQTEIRVGTCQEPPEGCTVFPDSCGDGTHCIESPETGVAECVDHGEIAWQDPCSTIGDCQEGLRCFAPAGGEAICRLICNPNGVEPDSDCDDNETCNPVNDAQGNPLSWGSCY